MITSASSRCCAGRSDQWLVISLRRPLAAFFFEPRSLLGGTSRRNPAYLGELVCMPCGAWLLKWNNRLKFTLLVLYLPDSWGGHRDESILLRLSSRRRVSRLRSG